MRLLVSGCTRTLRRLWPDWSPVLGALLSPGAGNAPGEFLPWAADNSAFAKGGFKPHRYRRMLKRIAGVAGCLFVCVPDVVSDHAATLDLFREWRDEVAAAGHPLAFVGQDGCTPNAVPWADLGAFFVGGSTGWKLSADARRLMAEAKRRGLHVHMGRVNSFRRLKAARLMGADTADGTGMSKWGDVHLERFCRWAVSVNRWLPRGGGGTIQGALFGERGDQ